MNAQTITERIYDKTDAELTKRIRQSVAWIHEESNVNSASRPTTTEFPNVKNKGDTFPGLWDSSNEFQNIAYAYLRDLNRNRATKEFMSKVDSMAEEMENLGIVMRTNSEQSKP